MLRFYLIVFLISFSQACAATPVSADFKNFQRAAKQGFDKAKYKLEHLYQKSNRAVQSLQAKILWIPHAAKQGFARAQYYLAIAYKRGKGVRQSEAKAFKWFKRSAEQGYAPAQYHLGIQYYAGLGTRKNKAAGKKWLTLSAKQNFKPAQKAIKTLNRKKTPLYENIHGCSKQYFIF